VARTLLDRTLEALFSEVRPREDLEDGDPFVPSSADTTVVLSRVDERTAVATAVLLLSKLRERGGSRVDADALAGATEQLLEPFSEMERARIKREVARILLWLWEALAGDDPDEMEESLDGTSDDADTQLIPDRIYPIGDKLEIIRTAIREKKDLLVDYYTFYRGKLSWRRVSPQEMESDDYLIGFCHLRQEDRRFRVSRMRALRIVDRDEA